MLENRSRIEALIDGVFAIAITLMAFQIPIPTLDRGETLWRQILDLWPAFLTYTITFILIGAYWINHHRMMNLMVRVNHTFFVLQLPFLMLISLSPWANAILTRYSRVDSNDVSALVTYGMVMALLAIAFTAIWVYATRQGALIHEECDEQALRRVVRSYYAGPIVYLFATGLAFWNTTASLVLFTLIPISYLMEGPVKHVKVPSTG
jgi:uncharacterized membrane protein